MSQLPAKAVWLHLLSEGQFHTVPEIRDALPGVEVAKAVAEMTRNGALVREGEHREYRYGVTPACRVPRGLKLAEVVGVLQAS